MEIKRLSALTMLLKRCSSSHSLPNQLLPALGLPFLFRFSPLTISKTCVSLENQSAARICKCLRCCYRYGVAFWHVIPVIVCGGTVFWKCASVQLAETRVQQLQHELLAHWEKHLGETSNLLVCVQVSPSSEQIVALTSPLGCFPLLLALLTRSIVALPFPLSMASSSMGSS